MVKFETISSYQRIIVFLKKDLISKTLNQMSI